MDLIKFINYNISFTFAKYGDGEYLVCNKRKGQNCDNTKYTESLSNAVLNSYKYLSALDNSYLGKWMDGNEIFKYFENIYKPKWVDYESIIFKNAQEFADKLTLYKTIKNCKQDKIYICNQRLSTIAYLFNIDNTIIIHPSDWFEINYQDVLNQTINAVKNPDSIVILTSAGMGAKPLLADLRKAFSNAILIDIGSAFDIFTYTATRSFNMNVPNHIIDEYIQLIL